MIRALPAAASLCVLTVSAAAAQEIAVEWSAEHRTRYQSLSGQFRNGLPGSDQALTLRTLLAGEASSGRFSIGGEFQDSRSYFDDEGSATNSNIVNAAEILQAYVAVDASGLGGADEARLTVGRQTIQIGSGRIVGRNGFRNAINAFTGAFWEWEKGDAAWKAFFTAPIERRPLGLEDVVDNVIQIDKESEDALFWGVFHSRSDLPHGVTGEIFYYGFDDSPEDPRPEQTLHTPGFRIFTAPAVNRLDFEVEGMVQLGSIETVQLPTSVLTEQDVFAQYAHFEAGFTYDARFSPRVSIVYDFASGDSDPTDNEFGRFNGLFSPVAGDFGPTDIYTPFGRENLSSPGLKIEAKDGSRSSGFIRYRAFFLDEPADAWVRGFIQDPNGGSGDLIGHQADARVRYSPIPGRLRFEAGGAVLARGPYAIDTADGGFAPEAPDPVSYYSYFDAVLSF
ncbi:MAG: alginate export family protein [Pseudomonadota bacterium]